MKEKSTSASPFIIAIYHFLCFVLKIGLSVFYAKKEVQYEERLNFKTPCILVSNHPSSVIDPFSCVVEVPTSVSFLANSGLFKTPFQKWFFNTFYCFPIERYQDTNGMPLKNAGSFKKSEQFLSKGGCLYVAPEGTSFVERHLRKIKTGTARIALAAESKNNFELGLCIQPIGTNYWNPANFRSACFVNFGKPIQVADFQEVWKIDSKEAVRQLTECIANKLSHLIINTKDREEDAFIQKLEILLQNEAPLSLQAHFYRTKQLMENLRQGGAANGAGIVAFKSNVAAYFNKIAALKISDAILKNFQISPFELLSLIFGFPVFLFGYANNFLPCFVPGRISRHFCNDECFIPTFKFLSGLVLFPLFYGLQIGLVFILFGNAWIAFLYALSLIPGGLFAEWYMKQKRMIFQKWRIKKHLAQSPKLIENLLATRKSIFKTLSNHLP